MYICTFTSLHRTHFSDNKMNWNICTVPFRSGKCSYIFLLISLVEVQDSLGWIVFLGNLYLNAAYINARRRRQHDCPFQKQRMTDIFIRKIEIQRETFSSIQIVWKFVPSVWVRVYASECVSLCVFCLRYCDWRYHCIKFYE